MSRLTDRFESCCYRFGDCHIDIAARELIRGGQPQPVAPRVLDLLLYLLQHRARVVSKQELVDEVWDGALLTDSALAQCIRKARKAIGDSGDDAALIRTLHRVGYRFVGDVDVETHEHPQPDPDTQKESPAGSATPGIDPALAQASRPPRPAAAASQGLPGDAVVDRAAPAAPITRVDGVVRLHCSEQDIADCQAVLLQADGPERAETLASLAWHLRERDSRSALALAAQAQAFVDAGDNTAAARIVLVRAVVAWLAGDLVEAATLADGAIARCSENAQPAGVCDAALLLAALAIDRDEPAARDRWLELAGAAAAACGDPDRVATVQLHAALAEAQINPANARSKWELRIDHWLRHCGPGVQAASHYVKAIWASDSGDYLTTLRHNLASRERNLEAGQLRHAIRDCANVGAMFANLYDNDAALEWLGAALEQARATGWPLSIGNCLAQMGGLLSNMLDRFDEAADLLAEANTLLAAFPGTRSALQAMRYHADVELARGRATRALELYEALGRIAQTRRLVAYEMEACYSRSRALLALGRALESRDLALETAQRASAQGNDYYQYLLMHHLATLHRAHEVQPPIGVAQGDVVLHYLEQALAFHAVDSPGGVPPALLQDVADEHARRGEFRAAFEYGQRTLASRAVAQSSKLTSRAIAVRIRHDTERMRAEAAAQLQRADLLSESNRVLARMARFGQEITRQRIVAAIHERLMRAVSELLPGSSLQVYRMDPRLQLLECEFDSVATRGARRPSVTLDDGPSPIARCARERWDVRLIDSETRAPSCRRLLASLESGAGLIGVLAIDCELASVDADRERLIVLNLAAFAAIALENADVRHQLESAHHAIALAHEGQLDEQAPSEADTEADTVD